MTSPGQNPYTAQKESMMRAMLRGEPIDGVMWEEVIHKEREYFYNAATSNADNLAALEQEDRTMATKRTVPKQTAKLGTRVQPLRADDNRPKCKTHNKFMKYNPAEDRMECVEPGCPVKAWKRRTFKNTLGAELGEQPVVYRGALEFITDETGEVFLFLADVNAAVSLAGVKDVSAFSDDKDAANISMAFQELAGSFVDASALAAQRLQRQRKQNEELEQIEARRRRWGPLVEGKTQIMGVPLPPHLSGANEAAKIQREYKSKLRVGYFAGDLPTIDRIAVTIESLWPSRLKSGTTVLVYYNRSGDPIDSDSILLDRPVEVLEEALRGIVALEEQVDATESPVYVMYEGMALTAYGCRKLLQHEQAVRSTSRRYGSRYTP